MAAAAGSAAAGKATADTVDIRSLSLQQLQMLREQVAQELSFFVENFSNLRQASSCFEVAGRAVDALGKETLGKEVLVPLSSSLYVPGRLASTEKVLIDIGTGYYVERSIEDAKDYCDRKVKFLKEQLDKLAEVIGAKRQQQEVINMTMQMKMRRSDA